ncbi:MAG: plastocyanin/azurin family copper-binding protein [Solirubrobacteraceae bacterium]
MTATALAGFSFAAALGHEATRVTNVTVHAHEYYWTISQDTVPVGTVVFTIVNDGQLTHQFSIISQDSPMVEPGKTVSYSVTFTIAGQFSFVCAIGDHAELGMTGSLTVTGTPATTTAATTTTTATTPTVPTPTPPPTTVGVREKEFRIYLGTGSVKHGLVRFVVSNTGKLAHTFVIGRARKLIAPGKKATLEVRLAKGRARFFCSLPGHAARGMKGTLTVT